MAIITINNLLGALPWIFICLPLAGYIHPDEFFQSTEVMAFDVFDFKVEKTWEWTSDHPGRNVVFPVIVAGLPFSILKHVSKYLGLGLTSTWLVILPRIVMGMVLFLINRSLKDYAQGLDLDTAQRSLLIFLFRSCHVTLVFFTKTFSNNIEALIFLLLLIKLDESREKQHVNFIIGFLTIFGFFIRQSMLAFAFYPIAISFCNWILLSGSCNGLKIRKIFIAIASMVLGGLSAAALCFLLDCLYFWNQIESILFAITPFNLIKYNNNVDNLKLHGLHPWYLHLIVNMVLLFGPLYLLLLWKGLKLVIGSPSLRTFLTSLLTPKSSTYFLSATLVPVFILSLVPHQEPRYILPVIIPLVCFIAKTSGVLQNRTFYFAVIAFNIIGTSWYGFIHQGGILPSITHLNNNFKSDPNKTTSLIYWKTYKVPQHLFLQNVNDNRLNFIDMAGADWNNVENEIEKRLDSNYDQVNFFFQYS